MSESARTIFANALANVQGDLRTLVREHWQRVCENAELRWDNPVAQDCLRVLPQVWACSEFVARTCTRYPELLSALIDSGELVRPYDNDALAAHMKRLTAQATDEGELKYQLRTLRRREMLRIAWRDLAGWADLREVMADLSALADQCIDAALDWLYAAALERHGKPIGKHSRNPIHMVVLGLGKLGGQELNFSSDVDLIFAYPEQGDTTGKQSISNHEFFLQLGRRLINVLSEPTRDGFVFRVDMRLRPNGNSGPLALGFDAMEQYYQTHGREWERYALIKARVVAGDQRAGATLLGRLQPFVYRKYLDYGTVQALRNMKAMINRELQRKGMRDNIKLGPGGIREIEFMGQAFQLIRGGREPALQERRILKVLERLAKRGHLTAAVVNDLSHAYRFLRNTENRLQMIADRQTHQLPHEQLEQIRLATAMGFSDWRAFATTLRDHMHKVQQHFDRLFVARTDEQTPEGDQGLAAIWLGLMDKDVANKLLADNGFDKTDDVLGLLKGLRTGPAYSAFGAEGRSRMDRLMPLLLAASGQTMDPHTTLARLVKLVEAIGRRSAYFALLVENPVALSQLVGLCAASPWIADWISQHPVLLDELLDPVSLYASPTRAVLDQELRQRLAHVAQDDLESYMEILREFRHGHILRVAAADIGPGLSPEQVGVHLACIADIVLEQSLTVANATLVQKHGDPICHADHGSFVPGFAVIGYGKLGSLELGYSSDLDMIFLYEACAAGGETDGERSVANEVFFARLGQRLIHILTARTRAGALYEVDMRLRPSGQSGPLVTSLTAFREYQRDRAWTWEHQALVRARAITGKPELCRGFADVRRAILCARREPQRLREDVIAMRDKMSATHAHRDPTMLDVKHDRGGIVDIEFMVQYWVLLWAAEQSVLADYTDNISILEALADTGLLDASRSQVLIDAYRCYLSTEHRLRLTEQKALISRRELSGFPEAVTEIWRSVFERV
ncbi:MAG: bifunctional [glutamate--ammonia ligase]-adenylyl-L-tyrosine phosphorylase/[glutamate--ammonia-ligase] adenylyltransferase [Acidiferrobacterales bacterium]